jgi:hypothetical protein
MVNAEPEKCCSSSNINVTASVRLALYDAQLWLSLVHQLNQEAVGREKVGLLYLNVEVEGNSKRCLCPFHWYLKD